MLDFDLLETPLECLLKFRELTGNKRLMMPEELKAIICDWIDNNMFNVLSADD